MTPSGVAEQVISDPDGGREDWRRLALGGGAGMFIAMGLGRFSYTAMVPALVESGGLSPLDAGRIGTANFVGFFLGAFLSVALARWCGRLRLLKAALGAAVAGLIASAVAEGVLALAAARGVIGVATGVIMVHSLAVIAEAAPPRARAVAGSFIFAGVGLGILASAVIVPLLLANGLAITWWSLAAAGGLGAFVALWGWWPAGRAPGAAADHASQGGGAIGGEPVLALPGMAGLLAAHLLFSFGIVPHSLYWVDFLVREQGLGFAAGGVHWGIVGVSAVLGPLGCAALARWIGTRVALIGAFVALGLGILAPALLPGAVAFVASSMLFGAQPGLSALMAARARDLGRADAMSRVMRAMILANAAGAFAGGVLVPWAYAASGRQDTIFILGGAAMLAAAAAAWPRRRVAAAP